MTPTTYDDAQRTPLVTDALLLERIRSLLGRAAVRQLWLVFLDEHDVQLPLLIPVNELPAVPGADDPALLMGHIAQLLPQISAAEVVLVWERWGAPSLTAADRRWIDALVSASVDEHVLVRAVLLAHHRGVRLVDVEEYRAAGV